jgi:LDH2 family malate/lactate/ureidoglycolate dehydrogenase
MNINYREITDLSNRVLQKHGYTTEEAEQITSMLLWAEKRGSSQGFSKLFGWRIKKELTAKIPIIEKNNGNMTLINAEQNSHIVACNLGVSELLKNMKDSYSCTVGIKNAVNSAGALGYYTEQIANAGYIAIMMSAADPGVAPYGGSQAVYGTNPISISIPSEPNPIILDMSIANLTWGDLIHAQDTNQKLPEDSAFDENGNTTQDPQEAMDGCVKTFDNGHKGSGLALMIQILAGPLVGSVYAVKHEDCQYGSLIIAINPEFFGNREAFINNVKHMISEIKGTQKAEGFNEISMPSESSYRNAKLADKSQSVNISDELFEKITTFLKS